MKLRNRVLLLLGTTLVSLITGVYLLSSRLLLQSYIDLENQQVTRNLEIAGRASQHLVDSLHEKSYDWSNWDDTYRFMADHNQAYITSNLVDASLQGLHLDIVLYVDSLGKLYHAKTIHRLKDLPPPAPAQVLTALRFDRLSSQSPLQRKALWGVVQLPEQPIMVTVRPIHNSMEQGPPRGWLVFGRYFTAEETKLMGERTRLDIQTYELGIQDLPAAYRQIPGTLSAAKPNLIRPWNEHTIAGFTLLYDIHQKPVMLMRIVGQRDIYQQGLAHVHSLVRLIALSALAFSIVVLILLERFILSRLASLSRQVEGITELQLPLPRVCLPGKDELTGLAGKMNAMLAALEDKAARLRQSEEQLRAYSEGLEQTVAERTRELQVTNAVLENALDGVALLDAEGRYISVNTAYADILSMPTETILGNHWTFSVHPGDLGRVQDALTAMHRQGKVEIEARGVRQDGSVYHIQLVLLPSAHTEGKHSGVHCFMKDVTERKRLEEQIVYQAFHDTLTGLPNRALFMQRLSDAQAQSERECTSCAVLFLDLDNFKYANDSLGHENGDLLLIAVAQRLVECVSPGDTVARLGGDEFTLLLEGLHSRDEAINVAERIVANLRAPIRLTHKEFFASASIGIAYSENWFENPETLLRDADTAMYQAKARGESGYVLFDPSMKASVMERMEIEIGLHHALEREEFRVHYQPLIDLASGRLVGTEALIRWQHPTRGLIPPSQFIPIAEETGMIVPIGFWVLEEACKQTKTWQGQYLDEPKLSVSVNLSTRQLQQEDVVERVAQALQRTGLPPACLKLEITESVLMSDAEDATAKMRQLKRLGVKLAIDDFGTGYSSMSYLSTFPVDTVKIDRAFISRLGEQEEATNVVSAIIMLSRALMLDITAEGIETEEQVIRLQGLGCHIGQGFFFAKPVTSKEMNVHLTGEAGAFIKARDEADQSLIEKLLTELSATGRLAA